MIKAWKDLEREKREHLLVQLNKEGLPFDKYVFSKNEGKLQLLGEGGQGVVYEAEAKRGRGKNYAIKVSEVSEAHNGVEETNDIVKWQKLLGGSVNHILKIVACEELYVWLDEVGNLLKAEPATKYEERPFDINVFLLQFIVMEKLEPVVTKCGDKKDIIHTLAQYNEKEVLKLAHEIGIALEELHKKKILHRDIKLENIFYSPTEKEYYLGDFGIAEVTIDDSTYGGGYTKGYAAPEVFNNPWNKHDYTADIYSFGITIYVLMNGFKKPECDANGVQQYEQEYILPDAENGSKELFAIVKKMCEYDPDDRYQSMEEVLNDLEELAFGAGAKHKREHKNSYLVSGLLFALSGIGVWKWSFAPQIQLDLSVPTYSFLIICVGKLFLGEHKKVKELVNLAIFFLGIYLMFSTGFAWWKVVLWLLMCVSSGKFSCLAGGGILMVDIVEILINNNSSLTGVGQSYCWLAVTLLSQALFWLIQYCILSTRYINVSQKTELFFLRMYLTKNIYTVVLCGYYVSTIMLGDLIEKCARQQELIARLEENDAIIKSFYTINASYNIMYEMCQKLRIWDGLVRCDLKKVGIAGLAFGIFWLVRDWIIHKSENLKGKNK